MTRRRSTLLQSDIARAIRAARAAGAAAVELPGGILIRRAKEEYEAMTPDERDAMAQEQAKSWARGEMGIGLDREEAAWRKEAKG